MSRLYHYKLYLSIFPTININGIRSFVKRDRLFGHISGWRLVYPSLLFMILALNRGTRHVSINDETMVCRIFLQDGMSKRTCLWFDLRVYFL